MKYLLLSCIALSLLSCETVSEKAKSTVNKTGEVVAKTSSEFVEGVSKGVAESLQPSVEIDSALTAAGIGMGKILVASSNDASDNILSVYFVFEKNVKRTITVKLFDGSGVEFRRQTVALKGAPNEAYYVDIVFDKRVNIDAKTKVSIK
ncbi:MAG TPA: hypothetical protein DCL43_06950 [Chitinophagaceae bacterium]|nr:hypothetical protein [Chitinophagaceae bacterium]